MTSVFKLVDWLFENPGHFINTRMDNEILQKYVDGPYRCPCTFLKYCILDARPDCVDRAFMGNCGNCEQSIKFDEMFSVLMNKWGPTLSNRVYRMLVVLIHYKI